MSFYDFRRKSVTLIRYARENGIRAVFGLIRSRFGAKNVKPVFGKIDIIGYYDFVRLPFKAIDANLAWESKEQKTINWIIPPFGKGSGGHLNIFRFIFNLERLGFDCRVVIVGSPQPPSAAQAAKEITEWFYPLRAKVYVGMENAPAAFYTVATEWRTAYWVRNFELAKYRCYFVQDFEPWFFAAGSEYVFAEETYRFGLIGITAGGWLKEKLAFEYGMKTYSVGFSYDKNIYRPIARQGSRNTKRVFFYARPPTTRRAFELGLLVLEEVCRRISKVEVILAGWDVSNYSIPFSHVNAGLLKTEELPAIYGQCDVALVLSLSNLSLLPLELMACGIPVVSNDAPWTSWLLHESNSRLAPPTVNELASALCHVLSDQLEAERLRAGGFATADKTDWGCEAESMAKILLSLTGDLITASS